MKPDIMESKDTVPNRSLKEEEKSQYYFTHDSLVGEMLQHVENLLSETVRSDNPMMDSIGRHMLFGYAKRLRPIFILLSQKLFVDELLPGTIDCAAAAELIHSASLFHDDVIDGSGTRKGKKSANSVWGNKSAVIMGDHFFVLAYTLISRQKDIRIIDFFVDLCRNLSEGLMQEITYTGDLQVSERTHLEIIKLKTASFFQFAMRIGGYLAGAESTYREKLEGFGLNFGLAFQLSDDLLDLFADPGATGKPRGSDIRGRIYTIPVIHALASNTKFTEKYLPVLEQGDISTGAIDEISNFLKSNGSLIYAQSLVKKHADIAYGYLEQLPDCQAALSFRSMLDNIVSREF
ncbi:MAG: polyprenyl synthetase family protein [bacterium]|nr:polyprenyl synthetase family protein [bacterium]